jgi:hypothetical protein
MNSPKFFVAVFGDPQPPGKNTVESGEYHPIAKYRLSGIQAGDLILLYCTSSYWQFSMKIPAIGVVLGSDSESVKYRYLPFKEPIDGSRMSEAFTPVDREKFSPKVRRFPPHQLFEISAASFVDTVADQQIDWSSIAQKVEPLPKKSA